MLAHTNSQKRHNYQMCGLSVVKHQVSQDFVMPHAQQKYLNPPLTTFTP